MSDKTERGRLLIAVLGTIGAIAVLMFLFGCGPKHYAPHPLTPAPFCSHHPESCSCPVGFTYDWLTRQCAKEKPQYI